MTERYTMILDIDNAARDALLAAGSRVVVAKPSGNGTPNVAWLAWDPLPHNVVSWTESYGVYAAAVPSGDGTPIRVLNLVYPASDGKTYPYHAGGFGSARDGARIPPGHRDVVNRTASALAFGLLQEATVNRALLRAPVNAVVLPAGLAADFVSPTAVYAWIQPSIAAGSCTAGAPPNAAVIEFRAGSTSRRCRYDRASSRFIVDDRA